MFVLMPHSRINAIIPTKVGIFFNKKSGNYSIKEPIPGDYRYKMVIIIRTELLFSQRFPCQVPADRHFHQGRVR